jgi:tRNA threonylcarbamoyl adenosine modification protein YjeE
MYISRRKYPTATTIGIVMKILTYHLMDIDKIAAEVAKDLKVGDVVTLTGDLGAGKTTFARALIQSLLDESIEVLSPTFTLVQPYIGKQIKIWHFDLYRLKSLEEVTEIGLQEALDEGISIIEWPEMADALLPPNRIRIALRCKGEEIRELTVHGHMG